MRRSDGQGPQKDVPFPAEVISYCGMRLAALGIRPDRKWLEVGEVSLLDRVTAADHEKLVFEARKKVPRSSAFWEVSEFYRYIMPVAVFDVVHGPMERFEHFELLYGRLLGEEARPWLPSLYLAAASSPAIASDRRVNSVRNFDLDRLQFEQEAADRAMRLFD